MKARGRAMKARVCSLVALSLLTGCAVAPLKQQDLVAQPVTELCTTLAVSALTGSASLNGHPVSELVLMDELKRRGEMCDPWQGYVKLAVVRLKYQAQAQAAATARQQALSAALLQASATFQAMQPRPYNVPAPVSPTTSTTNCHKDNFGNVQCTTNSQ